MQPALEATGSRSVSISSWRSARAGGPGNPTYQTKNTPKVVGGHDPTCLKVAMALYHPASTPGAGFHHRGAELVKLLRNTFRSVNIGLATKWPSSATSWA
jgi:UDP-N-acetyl-D-glucosamine dehydrogenase